MTKTLDLLIEAKTRILEGKSKLLDTPRGMIGNHLVIDAVEALNQVIDRINNAIKAQDLVVQRIVPNTAESLRAMYSVPAVIEAETAYVKE